MRAWGMALLLAAGCGLADYEKRLQEAEKRAARFDEQAKGLGSPLDMPMAPPKPKLPPAALGRVFLRPPRGFSIQPAKEVRSGDRHPYWPSKAGSALPFFEVDLAFGTAGDQEFHARLAKAIPGTPGPKSDYATHPPARAGTRFWRTIVDAGTLEYSVNTWPGGDHGPVAAVFCYDKAARAAASKAIDLSLETFAADAAADPARIDYMSGGPLGTVPR